MPNDAIAQRRRLVLSLRDSGRTLDQIADLVGTSRGTVHSDLAASGEALSVGDVVLSLTSSRDVDRKALAQAGFDVLGGFGQPSVLRFQADPDERMAIIGAGPGRSTDTALAVDRDQDYETLLRSVFSIFDIDADQLSFVVPTNSPTAYNVAEGHALGATTAKVFAASPTLEPKRIESREDASALLQIRNPEYVDNLVTKMFDSVFLRLFQNIVGADTNGLLANATPAGVLVTEYATADKGSEGVYRDAQESLGIDLPLDSGAFIISEDLYRSSARTLREPGSDIRVARPSGLLDERLIRLPFLGQSARGAWSPSWKSAISVGLWRTRELTIDRISQPGVVIMTAAAYADFALIYPNRVAVIKEA